MKIFLERIDYDDSGEIVATFEVDEDSVRLKENQMPQGFAKLLIPNAIVECEIKDGFLVNPKILIEETKQREEELKGKLKSLFE